MSCLGNLLWILFGGLELAVIWAAVGCLWCLTVVGIPIGIACFRVAEFALLPFGRELVDAEEVGERRIFGTALFSLVWILLFGIWITMACAVMGVLMCVTVIGIPFGLAYFRLAKAAFNPLGKRVVSGDALKLARKLRI